MKKNVRLENCEYNYNYISFRKISNDLLMSYFFCDFLGVEFWVSTFENQTKTVEKTKTFFGKYFYNEFL